MKKGIYSLQDRLNGFMSITIDDKDEIAIRGFQHALACAPRDSLFMTNPDDYSLYKIGEFDTDSGQITPIVPPLFLMRGERHEG